MTHENITTVSHRMLEFAATQNRRADASALTDMLALPLLVFDKELLHLFESGQAQTSVSAMMQAGVGHLPYPAVTVEMWGGMPGWRVLCAFSELQPDRFHGIVYVYNTERHWPEKHMKEPESLSEGLRFEVFREPEPTPPGGDPSIHYWRLEYFLPKGAHLAPSAKTEVLSKVVACLNLTLLSGHLGGLERTVVEPTRLNYSRGISGKPHVPTHTVLRVGHVYASDGTKHTVTSANRRGMPIHMRAGHTRMQQHGATWKEDHPQEALLAVNTDTHHIVYIPPVLVNYQTDQPLAVPLPKRVRL